MSRLQYKEEPTKQDMRAISQYLKELGIEDVLSKEEEYSLVKRMKLGDAEAKEKLITSNLRFVVSVANKEARKRFSHLRDDPSEYDEAKSDLISEGNLGLMKAIERFDETQGYKLISYAVFWIRQAMIVYSLNQSHTVRLPSNRIAVRSKVRKLEDSHYVETGEKLTLDEIACETGLTKSSIRNAFAVDNKPIRLDIPISNDTETTLYDFLPDPNQLSLEASLLKSKLRKDIEYSLKGLAEREAEVIRLYFGLEDNGDGKTLEEIGIKFGVTRERVRQIKEQAIRKLRHHSRRGKLESHWREMN